MKTHTLHLIKLSAIAIIAGTLLGTSIGLVINNARSEAESRAVYKVCNESRISSTIDEKGCGELQDALHYEFLCETNNTNPATHCWVEKR